MFLGVSYCLEVLEFAFCVNLFEQLVFCLHCLYPLFVFVVLEEPRRSLQTENQFTFLSFYVYVALRHSRQSCGNAPINVCLFLSLELAATCLTE